jgi:hypothetical protein
MIIETSANRFYQVEETNQPGLDHVWYGRRVKRVGGMFGLTAKAVRSAPELVRKAATKVIEE